MGKVVKRIVIAAVVVLVAFFAVSLVFDRVMLDSTFARVQDDELRLLPTEDYMAAYDSTPVEFQLDGQTLRGYVYAADSPRAFIVFRHGIFSQHGDYLALVAAMVERGYTVFAYDALGCGISDGDDVRGMAQSARDVTAAVRYVRDEGLAGGLPLVLWGHSWGGYGVAAALAGVPDVDACVTMSGYDAPVEVLVDTAVTAMGPFAATQRPTLWLWNKLTFGDDADRTAVAGINATDAPVLVIHGTEDAVVRYDVTAVIAQAGRIANPNVEYLTYSEEGRGGHNSYFYSEEANAYLAEKQDELAALEERYPDGIPDAEKAAFMAGYDQHLGNVAAPDLIDAIDGFLTSSVS